MVTAHERGEREGERWGERGEGQRRVEQKYEESVQFVEDRHLSIFKVADKLVQRKPLYSLSTLTTLREISHFAPG